MEAPGDRDHFDPALPGCFDVSGFIPDVDDIFADQSMLYYLTGDLIMLFQDAAGSLHPSKTIYSCLLYTSDAADDLLCVDLGGRRIIKKKKSTKQ